MNIFTQIGIDIVDLALYKVLTLALMAAVLENGLSN